MLDCEFFECRFMNQPVELGLFSKIILSVSNFRRPWTPDIAQATTVGRRP